MLSEVLEHLNVEKGQKYIDCTLGDGGHTIEILKRGGRVLGIDANEDSLLRAVYRINEVGLSENFESVLGNFKNIDNLAKIKGFSEVRGILYDLGYSTTELDDETLGLSFLKDQPLDMRLDESLSVTAADLLNTLPEKELARMFFEYGQERLAKRFAKEIVVARGLKKFQKTSDLSDLIVSVAPPGYEGGRIHPATRVFQSLRIAVNDELENLKLSLPRAESLLLPGGRMIVISFHSLEDLEAKKFGRGAQPTVKEVFKKPLLPGRKEILENRHARSAKMRVFEKIL